MQNVKRTSLTSPHFKSMGMMERSSYHTYVYKKLKENSGAKLHTIPRSMLVILAGPHILLSENSFHKFH